MAIQILPSLLAADFGMLAKEISRAAASGAAALHIDVMDAHFVPNLSFGPDIVSLARRVEGAFHRHVHLMMTDPAKYLHAFAAAGAQTLQIHVEAASPVRETLQAIRAAGIIPSLAINPETPVEKLYPFLDDADEFLVMTVHPGFGAQKFIEPCLDKIRALREKTAKPIMVDGGVNLETARLAAAAGANRFVAGSFLFGQSDMAGAVARLAKAAAMC